ncbi:MAG: NYN domain-containing protein, partial [Victivallales bacterium]|nr:NYN domain-containing protein [Victivallales bacterium]
RLVHEHEEELQRIQSEHQQQLTEAVTQERRRLLGVDNEWLTESQQVKDDVEQAIFEARHILEVQRQSNELHGTRAALREKLSVLDKLYAELQNTVQEALVVHPDTEHALRQLEKMQEALQGQLQQGGEEHKVCQPFLYHHLMAKIKGVTMDERLPDFLLRLRDCANRAQVIGMLTPQELAEINSASTEQERLWHNLRLEQHVMPPRQRIPGDIPEILDLSNRPEMPQVTIFLDAYNVIRRSDYWNRLINERKGNNTEVRLAFNRRCISIGGRFRKIKVVYDGNDPLRNTVERFPNVDIIFAKRSQEEHNADNYIIDYVLHHKRADDLYWLVSDDHDLCMKAKPALDAIVSTQAFNKFLGAATL